MNAKKIAKYITLWAVFLVPLFPLVVVSSLVVPYITGQAFFFRILVEVAFAAWVILALLDPTYRPRFTPLTIAISAFVGLSLVADLAGVDPLRSIWSNFDRMDGWITTAHLWAFYMVIKSVFGAGDTKRLWNRWVNLSLVIAFVVAMHGLFQSFGWMELHFGGGRIDSSFGNPTFLAAYLLFNAFLATYLFADSWGRKPRSTLILTAYAIAVLLFVYNIFETGTRGSILGLIIGSMMALAAFSIFGPRILRKWRVVCGCAIALVIILGGAFWFNRTNPIIQRSATLSRFAAISWTAGDQSRQYIWPIALKGIAERPLLGWGQGNFVYLFQKHYNPDMYAVEQWVDSAHNIFLDQLSSFGVIGLLSYVAIFVFLLFALWRSSLALSGKCIITGLLFGYVVHNLFVFDTLSSYLFFFVVLAMVDSINSSHRSSNTDKISVSNAVTTYVIAPVIIIIFVIVVYYLNIRPFLANKYLSLSNDSCSQPSTGIIWFQKAISMSNVMSSSYILSQLISCTDNVLSDPAATGQIKQSLIDLVSKQIAVQISDTPNDAYVYYISGPFLKKIGRFSDAESLLEKAHLLAPAEQVISFELASVYLFENKADRAVDLLKQAYELAPGYTKAASAYAVVLVLAGHADDAATVLEADSSLVTKAKAYVSSGQPAQATAIYQNLIAPQQSISALIQQARIQYAAGNTENAVSILRSIESSYPQAKDEIEAAIKEVQP
jgi:O-antigen ligase/cytochrome c-type biogenesis protein CcmH/NrfG